MQNTAARLVFCIRKSAHITPVLMKLHWLPVQHRVKFKILMQVFEILNGQSSLYLVDLISRHVPTRALRSRDANLLALPRSSSKFGDRRFSVSDPRLWNDLPTYIKNAESLTQFKTLLKTYFFTQVNCFPISWSLDILKYVVVLSISFSILILWCSIILSDCVLNML